MEIRERQGGGGEYCAREALGLPLAEPNPKNSSERPAWNRLVLDTLSQSEPPYCECAHFAKRPLSWFAWIPGISSSEGSALDSHNLELSHEHLFWDQSGSNIGFGPHGLFGESKIRYRYRDEGECFNGSVMRQALTAIDLPGRYNFFSTTARIL